MTSRSLRLLRALGILLVFGALAVAVRGLELRRVGTALATADWSWLLGALAAFLGILPLWAMEWKLLAPAGARPSLGRMFQVVAMTSSVLNTTAMLVGEAAAMVLLVAHAGLARAAAVSVLAVDQLLVGIAKLALLALAASLADLPAWMTAAFTALLTGVALLLAILMLAAWRHADVGRLLGRALPARYRGTASAFGTALAPLRSPSLAAATLLIALSKKAVELLAIVCVQRAFGVVLPIGAAVLVLATLNVVTLLPLVPGDAGVYEGAVVVAYGEHGIAPELALAMAVVQHACYFAALALPGYWWLARLAPLRGTPSAPPLTSASK